MRVNGDLVPAFSDDFFSFMCLEMASRKICSVTFLETEVKLTSLQFSWILLTLFEDEPNISLFPITEDLP